MRFIILLLLFPVLADAAQCTAVFGDPASSYSPDGSISFKKDAFVRGSDGVLDISDINIQNQNGTPTCSPVQCSSSGQTAESIGLSAFQFTSSDNDISVSNDSSQMLTQGDYKDVVVGNRADLVFTSSTSGVTKLEKLELKTDANVFLAGGVYWIKQLIVGNRAFIRINSNESVIIYTSDTVDIKNDAFLNPTFTNPASTADQLLLISYDSVEIGVRSIVNGFIYAAESIDMKTDAIVYGAINAEEIELGTRAFVEYRADALDNLDGGSACSGSQQGPNRYRITFNSPALTCDAAEIDILVCADDSCNTPFTDYPVSVSVTNGNGDRQNKTFTSQTSFTIARKTEGLEAIAFATDNVQSAPLNPTLCEGNCSIEFVNAGLVLFDSNSGFSSPLPDQKAEVSLSRLGIAALRDPGDESGVCAAALEGTRTLDLSYNCIDGATGYSSDICRVPFAGIPVNGDGSGVSTGQISVTFNNEGIAQLSDYSYADAGRVFLSVSGQITGADLSPTVASDSDNFDSIPNRLVLQSSSTGTSPTRAAASFEVTVQALGAQNGVLPGYQPASLHYKFTRISPDSNIASEAELTLENAVLTSSTTGTFSGPVSIDFDSGVFNTDAAKLNESGEYSLELQDQNYLGSDAINTFGSRLNTEQPTDLGRFIPAYFEASINSPRTADACTSFTYIGQAFGFNMGAEPIVTLVAMNAEGEITNNYDSAHWTLNPSASLISNNTSYSVTDNTGYTAALLLETASTFLSAQNPQDYDGTQELVFNNVLATYTKTAASAAGFSPFNSNFNLTIAAAVFTDATFGSGNAICVQSNYPDGCESIEFPDIGDTQQRYGRLNLMDTYGPETRSLRVPIVAEHLVNGLWATNTVDSCTPIDIQQTAGQMSLTNASTESYETDITSLYSTIQSNGVLSLGISDTSDLVFSAPVDVAGNSLKGRMRLTLEPGVSDETWSEFLNVDWNLDGVINTNDKPSAEVSFGQFRGNDRLLNWRELR
ncbi:hypothetical protein DRW07_15570 [Alteromonas sediminis]|uniref:DUF6701 domain-containing protein n=1 Tax=Alteromonas sediminis TaxID=2259342 RepID=A0A3N5XX34_9ALTE|nr:DUF6701 domain-containing protein [Alteromonas sediminis]RPJ65322.1 hypothetical protein DRW07_15570 [Alteromonas sediminis]